MFSFIYHGHTVDVASDACWAALSQESVDWGAIDPNWAYTMLLEGKRAIHWTRNNTLKAQRQWRTVLINGKPLFVSISTPTLPSSLTNPAYSFWSLLISIATKMLIILFPRKHTWIVWVDTLIWRSALEWTMSSLHWGFFAAAVDSLSPSLFTFQSHSSVLNNHQGCCCCFPQKRTCSFYSILAKPKMYPRIRRKYVGDTNIVISTVCLSILTISYHWMRPPFEELNPQSPPCRVKFVCLWSDWRRIECLSVVSSR